MKAWISVSAAEDERVGQRRAMLRRWKKDVFLTLFMYDLKEWGGVHDDAKVSDQGGGSDRVTIDAK